MSRFAKAFVLLLSLIGLGAWSGDAMAIAKFARVAGNWSAVGTWSSVSCAAAGATAIPSAADDVTICNGINVTVDGAGTAGSVTIATGTTATALTLGAAGTLTVTNASGLSGNVIINPSTANVTRSLAVGARSLTVTGSVTINGGTTKGGASNISQLTVTTGTASLGSLVLNAGTVNTNVARATVTTGTVNVTGDVTLTGGGAASRDALLSVTGASAVGAGVNVDGNLNINATVATSSTVSITVAGGRITVNGAGGVNNGDRVSVGAGIFTVSDAGATFANSNAAIVAATSVSTGTLNIAGNLTNGNTGTNTGIDTITLSSTGTITVGGTLTNNTGTTNGTITTSTTGTINANGDFTNDGVFTHTAAGILNIGGNFSNSGTFNRGTGTVTFNGTVAQTLGGTAATTFNNLTLSNTATPATNATVTIVCGTPSPTVNATLTLTSGSIVTSGTSPACATDCASQVPVIVAAAGTVTGGSSTSYVQGALRKVFNAAATLNFRAVAGQDEFPVGDATNYSPVEITAGTTSTAGSVTACVTPTDHPQVTTPIATTGIDAAKSVNRYWSLTTATINTTAVPVDATFKFVAGDVDGGATTANFIVEDYSGTYWSPTTLVTAAATSTRAQNIDLTSTTNDIAIGEPLFGFTPLPGQFNAFETTTPAGAVLGMVQTKQSGVALSVRLVRLNVAKNAVDTTYTQAGVTVELLDSSDNTGALNAATGCRPIGAAVGQWHLIAGTSQLVNFNLGVISPVNFTVANSYRDVRVHIVKTLVGAGEGCSTDRFAIRPMSLTITAHDATWATAGIGRPLANTGASGGNVHKAATDLSPVPFTLRATPLPATATNYDGTPTTVAGFPTCGTLCTTVGGLSFTAGSWTAAGSGVRENATANYSEAGTFNLQLEDATYASVDAVDGSTPAMRTVPATASVEIGRFVPDHFDVTGLITPIFKTFNAADAVCSTGAAPRRTFTYIGQPFGYNTAPQATIFARNAAGSTTVNYSGTLWKIGGTSSSSKDCTTDPNICLFTTSWTGGGNSSSVAESYAYTLTPVSTPGWDNATAATAAATVTPGAGTGTIAISSSNILAFLRNTTTPQAAFTANITDTISVTDASENAVANNGIISTTTPLVFNGTGSGIDFDGGGASNGKEFRYGRLKLANAHGSELLDLPIPTQTQYWDATTSAFVTNSADNCTTLQSANIALVKTPVGCTTAVSGNVSFSSGLGDMKLTKPGAKCTADITANLAAEIPSKAYLQGKWSGVNYDQNPAARAIFGVYKGANEFIYMRENY
ncbi:MAG: hypothetical protein HY937_00650 [Nitrosomonadales bacterium]|nr:hypothetical protein [Nitrosomonadales bacterium]